MNLIFFADRYRLAELITPESTPSLSTAERERIISELNLPPENKRHLGLFPETIEMTPVKVSDEQEGQI